MDLKQAEYIIKIAEEKNITRAAEKLFLTQPALNQQLIKLEKELGTQIFYRSRNNWKTTSAGEVYLESAKELLRIQHETYNKIQDIVNAQKGVLSIGITPTRGTYMFSEIYNAFHSLYPDVTIEPIEMNTRNQQKAITAGELDLGFVTLCDNQKTTNHYITLCCEELVLALPKKHPLCQNSSNDKNHLVPLDIKQLQGEPFVNIYKKSTLRPLIDQIFQQAGFQPHVLFETSNTNTIVRMINSSLCYGILPKYHMNENYPEVAYFALDPNLTWEIAATYRNGGYLSKPAQAFIQLAREFWNKEE